MNLNENLLHSPKATAILVFGRGEDFLTQYIYHFPEKRRTRPKPL